MTKLKNNKKNDHRSRWDLNQLKIWNDSNKLFYEFTKNKPMASFALRYCLSFNQVFAVIPGMMNKNEVDINSNKSNKIKLGVKTLKKVLL